MDKIIQKLLPKRKIDGHKGTFGKILNVAGSRLYTGAAYLSSLSALRVGAGYVTLASSEYVCKVIASLTPDITFLPLANLDDLDTQLEKYNVISIGCGLSQSEDAQKIVNYLIESLFEKSVKVIIDADGLNILAKSKIKRLNSNFILTPHSMELSRLLGISVDDLQENRLKYAKIACEKYDCTIVLKGHNTIIVSKDNVYINNTGNSALAKAGTGDVLTGMITGFCAQGCSGFDACKLAVYVHGLIGEEYSKKNSQYSLLASEMLNYIPKILTKM